MALWKRDSSCHICGLACSRDLKGGAKGLAPAIDHVKPLASGGDHSLDNTALSHRICNDFKSDRQLTQEMAGWCRDAVTALLAGRNGWAILNRRVAKAAAEPPSWVTEPSEPSLWEASS
ncbi:MAG: HNH endonuclease [Acidobacteriota bacterium]|nr:HNH endonuclease [Acidobacteriota bacterium]